MTDINVLVVDDNDVDVRLIQRLLKRSQHNCNVLTANDGEQALSLYRESGVAAGGSQAGWPPALVLLDINMPVMNGFEFLQALEELDLAEPTQKLYILSSSGAMVDRERAQQSALVTGYLVKPLNMEELEQLLDAC